MFERVTLMTQNQHKPMQFESLSLQRLGFRNIKNKYLMLMVINCFSAIFYSKKSYLSVKHVLIKNSYFFPGSKNSRNFLSTYKDSQWSSSLFISFNHSLHGSCMPTCSLQYYEFQTITQFMQFLVAFFFYQHWDKYR